jgi:hypothetical protein
MDSPEDPNESVARWLRQADSREVDQAARDLVARTHAPYRVAASLLDDPSPAAALNARCLLLAGGELGVTALTEAPLDGRGVSFALQAVAEAEVRLRERATAWMDALLTDTRPVPEARSGQPTEAAPVALRVCDEAYLALRRVLRVGEGGLARERESSRFLALSFAGRDAAIERLRADRKYRVAVLGEPDEDR